MRWVKFLLVCATAVAAAVYTAVHLGGWELRKRDQRIAALEQERTELIDYARRLSASRRVAQIDVLDQAPAADGRLVTTLRWQEIGIDGALGPPLTIEAFGDQVYFEAFSLKFEPHLVGSGDPERGTSLVLFRRVFGDRQPPESAPEIGRAARPPEPPERRGPRAEEPLWSRFWELVDDPRAAAQLGIRVAQCEAVSARMAPGQVWELSVDAIGGMNLRRRLIP